MEINEITKIDGIVDNMAQDYLRLAMSESSKKEPLKASLEDGISKVETFVDVADMVRKSGAELLEGPMKELSASVSLMHNYFESIDKLEAFVGVVRRQVDVLEDSLRSLEEEKKKGRKKYNILFLSNKRQKPAMKPFEPIEIFKTNLYFNHSSTSPEISSTISSSSSSTTSSIIPTTSLNTNSYLQQTTILQQPPTTILQQPPTTILQQPPTTILQQPPTTILQQPPTTRLNNHTIKIDPLAAKTTITTQTTEPSIDSLDAASVLETTMQQTTPI